MWYNRNHSADRILATGIATSGLIGSPKGQVNPMIASRGATRRRAQAAIERGPKRLKAGDASHGLSCPHRLFTTTLALHQVHLLIEIVNITWSFVSKLAEF